MTPLKQNAKELGIGVVNLVNEFAAAPCPQQLGAPVVQADKNSIFAPLHVGMHYIGVQN